VLHGKYLKLEKYGNTKLSRLRPLKRQYPGPWLISPFGSGIIIVPGS